MNTLLSGGRSDAATGVGGDDDVVNARSDTACVIQCTCIARGDTSLHGRMKKRDETLRRRADLIAEPDDSFNLLVKMRARQFNLFSQE